MEMLWNLLMLLIVAGSIIRRIQKSANRQHTQQSPVGTGSPAPRPLAQPDPFSPTSWGAFFEQARQAAIPAPAPAPMSSPAPAPVYQELYPSMEGSSMEGNRYSLEGVDTCDPNLGHSTSSLVLPEQVPSMAAPASSPGISGLSLTFTPDALMQGIIMSEILTRPAQRKWGGR